MLNPRAGAPAANSDGRRALEVSLDGQMRYYRTRTRGHRGRIRQETSLLVLFGVRRQGYSTYECGQMDCLSEECRLCPQSYLP